jgi:hypothetical protein
LLGLERACARASISVSKYSVSEGKTAEVVLGSPTATPAECDAMKNGDPDRASLDAWLALGSLLPERSPLSKRERPT